MKKWRIKSKRDWMIAFVFALLIVYALTGLFTSRLNRMLMYLTDPRLSDLNQPSSYGNVALTALIMGVITAAVLFAKRRPAGWSVLSLAAGAVIAAGSIGAYFFHCGLLVHVPQEEQPGYISVSKGWGNEYGSVSVNYDPTDEALTAFVQLCTSLEELPKAEQEQASAFLAEQQEETGEDGIRIWISYPKKYLHSYSLLLWIRDGQIFTMRDGGRDRIFFADNGLVQAAEELIFNAGNEAEAE